MILVAGAAGLSGSSIIQEFVRQKTPVGRLSEIDQAPAGSRSYVEVAEDDMLRPE